METFSHQHQVRDKELEARRKILEETVLLNKTFRKLRLEIETIELPNAKIALRKGSAQLRHCRKVCPCARQEAQLRLAVSNLICVESQLYQAQKEQEDSYDSYLKTSEIFAKLSCRQLCERMQNNLPRELRDIIYQYMVGCTSVVLAPSSSRQAHRVALSPIREFDIETPPALANLPGIWLDARAAASQHIFNFAFVGFDTLSELVEIWYRATTFITSDVSLLSDFLSTDPWLLNLDISKLLRKIVVQISESSVRTLANRVHTSRRNGQDFYRIEIVPGRCNEALVYQIAHLNMFKAPTKVLLHIMPRPDYTGFNTFRLSPVDVWHKRKLTLSALLGGLRVVWEVLETLEEFGRDVEVCLDVEGQCVLNKDNAVWSPLGWLAKTMEYGYEQEAKTPAADP